MTFVDAQSVAFSDNFAEESRVRAGRVIAQFKSGFLNDDGLISRTYPASSRTILDNFDDIAPFLSWWGQNDLLLDQVKRLTPAHFDGLLPTGNLLYSYKIDEYVGGLNAVFEATGEASVRALRDDAIEKCWHYFSDDDVGLAEFYDYDSRSRSPFFSPWSAGLLETFLEIKEQDMAARVSAILDLWWSHPYVKETGLFPFRGSFDPLQDGSERFWAARGRWADEAPILWDRNSGSGLRGILKSSRTVSVCRRAAWQWTRSGRWSQLMKSNTTPIFLAIELYARTKDVRWRERILRWFEAVRASLVSPDGVYPTTRKGDDIRVASLVAGFITIDAACDAWWFVERNEPLLRMAVEIAENCLEWRWENGLIPMTPRADRDHLDGQVDFSISLRRLGELTGNERFMTESVSLLRAAIERHDTGDGYCTHVRRDGSVVVLPANTVDPKYNGLLLKGFLSLCTLDRPIYGDSGLSDLFKDR